MSTTLSKGYIQPAKGEKVTWWSQLNFNILRLNNHTHNGVDSQLVSLSSLTKTTQSILSANWVASAVATPYKQLITMPSPLNFDVTTINVRLTSDGCPVHPTIKKITSTTFEMFVNDNTLNLTIVYA